MFRSLFLTAGLTLATAGALHAQSFRAENRLTVTAVSQNTFATSASGYFGARGAWCAAADYAQDVLGAPGTTRIYVREAVRKPGSRVVFGTTAGNTSPQSVSSVGAALRVPGSNLSLDHAIQFCHDARLINSR